LAAYQLAVHGVEVDPPISCDARDYLLLANIGAGWLWTKADSVLDRIESNSQTVAHPHAKGLAVNRETV
jgi:hypothetical protein